MSGLVKGTVTGGHLHLDSETVITNADVAAGANPTKEEYDALVGKFNELLAQLKDNNVIKS